MFKWNVAIKVNKFVELGLWQSLILLDYHNPAVWFHVLDCRKNWNSILEKFQKKVVKRIRGNEDTEYKSQLRLLNILPQAMFIQF